MQSKGNFFYVKKPEVKDNFTQVPNQIFKLDLTAIEKLILIYLFSNSETFRITNYRIEQDLGSERRTVKKTLSKFRKLNFINDINSTTISLDLKKICSYTSNSTGSNPTGIEGETTSKSTAIDTSKYTDDIPVNQPASNSTASNSTGTIPVIELVHTSNLTGTIPVEIPNTNTNQPEIKEEPQQGIFLNLDSSLTSNSSFKISPELKSVYFGSKINQQLIDFYFNDFTFKSEIITFSQFEVLFIYPINIVLTKLMTDGVIKKVDREELIKFITQMKEVQFKDLNKYFTLQFIKNFKDKEFKLKQDFKKFEL